MTIPKPHRWAYEACADLPDGHPARARAAKALDADRRSHLNKLAKSRPRRKAAAQAHQVETGATRAVYQAVSRRARGRSEYSGDRGRLQMDHFFGRQAPETVETCWMLTRDEHLEKTNNRPSRLAWLLRFRDHAQLRHFGRALALLEPLIALEIGQHPEHTP